MLPQESCPLGKALRIIIYLLEGKMYVLLFPAAAGASTSDAHRQVARDCVIDKMHQ